MADIVKMQVMNAQLVQNALNAFEKKISKKVVRQGVRAAWSPLLKRAKANAKALTNKDTNRPSGHPKMGALIARNLQLRAFRKQRKGQYGMLVRIKGKVPEFYGYRMGAHSQIRWSTKLSDRSIQRRAGKTIGQAYIPAAIEYGHAFPGKGGSGSKDVAAKSFMRKALDVTLPHAPKIFEKHLVHAIHEENAKRR